MGVQVEKLDKNMAKITIEVSLEDLEKAIDRAYQKAKSRISLPGFRKGKAPRKMIERMYGKGVFLEDAANDLIPTEYRKAQRKASLRSFLSLRSMSRSLSPASRSFLQRK